MFSNLKRLAWTPPRDLLRLISGLLCDTEHPSPQEGAPIAGFAVHCRDLWGMGLSVITQGPIRIKAAFLYLFNASFGRKADNPPSACVWGGECTPLWTMNVGTFTHGQNSDFEVTLWPYILCH